MNDSRVKRSIQKLAVATQFPPLTWLYRGIYAAATRLCLWRLRRQAGVRAVYLRRGLAAGGAVYGLSDIDLLVLVDPEDRQATEARVRHQYDLLCRLVPMLSPGELELYDPPQMRSLHEHSPFCRNRFEEGRRQWIRLWGEDLFGHLPPASESPAQELGPAWYFLAMELQDEDARPDYLRRYVAYKWLAEACRAALAANGTAPGLSRDEALASGASLVPEAGAALAEAAGWRGRLLSGPPVPTDDILHAFAALARKALDAEPGDTGHVRRLRLAAADVETAHVLDEAAVNGIRRACDVLDGVERAVLVPRWCFDPIALADLDRSGLLGHTVDAFDLVFVGRCLPPAEQLRKVRRLLGRLHPVVTPWFCDGTLALSLRPAWRWEIKHARVTPEFLAALEHTRKLADGLDVAAATEVERPFDRSDHLSHRARVLLDALGRPEVHRMPLRQVFALFWEAGRAVHLARQDEAAILDVPSSSGQVLGALEQLTPDARSGLHDVYDQYRRLLGDEPNEAVRYVHWMTAYAKHLKSALRPDGPPPCSSAG